MVNLFKKTIEKFKYLIRTVISLVSNEAFTKAYTINPRSGPSGREDLFSCISLASKFFFCKTNSTLLRVKKGISKTTFMLVSVTRKI